ncbi:DUF4262 domain-containing protein [Flavobacterium sp. Fl-318]|uniref:DUF4262 domain-containing protein n=1 Tax=Flavobacterium cupriresistens TaxID=2893885 RepID=A0ABU4R598_9FLAO|nr:MULTISPECIES: DUF4262 domain-containing protein [unclassified Flavobacterium]MDX6187755.1 DUF4262 domain-containing protein [Flavobacterium sp. Fl-318]MDX6187761.1 DUF4262 domain-containing protein [Flavobacterium sp. Fl-318]UFH42316.1 DUF4262 domain-containing protein [Flavobacterium sp. F-323]UFH42323.1 DUF4262 domain-containing protein [Flavobacterium sp. F-323]
MTNSEFLEIIKTSINNNDYHLTLVNGGQNPEYSYSIGLTEKFGFELVIAGGFISIKENESIFRYVYQQLQSESTADSKFIFSENTFYLNKVDSSWCEKLMLGVYDYYNVDKITAYQIIPENRTLDTPLMSQPIIANDPIWKWLDMDWNMNVPKNSYVITDIDSLKGKTIVELMRWEDHVWEMFSGPGPDFKEEDIRIVPLGTILGIDDTLQPTVNLAVGKGLWRENKDSEWNDWE